MSLAAARWILAVARLLACQQAAALAPKRRGKLGTSGVPAPADLPEAQEAGLGPQELVRYNCNGRDSQRALDLVDNLSRALESDGWAARVEEAFPAIQGPAILTIAEWHQAPLLRNFLAHAENASARDGTSLAVVNVALDGPTQAACEEARRMPTAALLQVTCVGLAGWLPGAMSAWLGSSELGNCYWKLITWTKPLLLRAAARAALHGVLLLDVDIVLRRNLLRWAQAHSTERDVLMTGSARNTASVFATQSSLEFLDTWVEEDMHLVWPLSDQTALLNAVSKKNGKKKKNLLQISEIPDTIISQYSHPDGQFAAHYSETSNVDDKIARMRGNGDWLLGDGELPRETASLGKHRRHKDGQ